MRWAARCGDRQRQPMKETDNGTKSRWLVRDLRARHGAGKEIL